MSRISVCVCFLYCGVIYVQDMFLGFLYKETIRLISVWNDANTLLRYHRGKHFLLLRSAKTRSELNNQTRLAFKDNYIKSPCYRVTRKQNLAVISLLMRDRQWWCFELPIPWRFSAHITWGPHLFVTEKHPFFYVNTHRFRCFCFYHCSLTDPVRLNNNIIRVHCVYMQSRWWSGSAPTPRSQESTVMTLHCTQKI